MLRDSVRWLLDGVLIVCLTAVVLALLDMVAVIILAGAVWLWSEGEQRLDYHTTGAVVQLMDAAVMGGVLLLMTGRAADKTFPKD